MTIPTHPCFYNQLLWGLAHARRCGFFEDFSTAAGEGDLKKKTASAVKWSNIKADGVEIPCKLVDMPIFWNTPPKTNMEPENDPLEEDIPRKNHHF